MGGQKIIQDILLITLLITVVSLVPILIILTFKIDFCHIANTIMQAIVGKKNGVAKLFYFLKTGYKEKSSYRSYP